MAKNNLAQLADTTESETEEVLSISDRGLLNFYLEKWQNLEVPYSLETPLERLDKAIHASAGICELLWRNESHRSNAEAFEGVRYKELDGTSIESLQLAQDFLNTEMDAALEDIEKYFRAEFDAGRGVRRLRPDK